MTRVERIEREIEQLSRDEFAELRKWFLERDWELWDAQIEADAGAGKLEKLIEESQEEYRSARNREL